MSATLGVGTSTFPGRGHGNQSVETLNDKKLAGSRDGMICIHTVNKHPTPAKVSKTSRISGSNKSCHGKGFIQTVEDLKNALNPKKERRLIPLMKK